MCRKCSVKSGIPFVRTVGKVYPSIAEIKKRIEIREEEKRKYELKIKTQGRVQK